MVNKVILLGNIGNDAEGVNETITKFSVATTESWTKDGERQEKTQWHNVVVYGKIAPYLVDRCKKGSQVYVEGRLETRKWTDNNNVERYSTEVIVDIAGKVEVMRNSSSGESSSSNSQSKSSKPKSENKSAPKTAEKTESKKDAVLPAREPEQPEYVDANDDDIPF
mgnify:CR=1 FL=1